MDQGSEKLSAVHPVLAAKVRAAAENLAARGVEIRVVQGMRTADEQDALYAKGRTVLMYSQGKAQPIVTKARGGYSSHNFGLGGGRGSGSAWRARMDSELGCQLGRLQGDGVGAEGREAALGRRLEDDEGRL